MTYNFTKIYDSDQTTWQQNLDKALNGTLVCFGATDFNILDAGVLVRENKGDASFSVTIGGVTYYTDRECKVLSSNPANQHTNDYLYLVTATIAQTTSNVITRGGGDTATISSSNPRDQFAMEILNAIIQKQNNPEMFDDAAMLRFTQVAYRWANTMMEIAADSRYNDSQAEQQAGNTSNGELQAIASALNTVTVKGNKTYTPSGGTAIPDVLNVNVVAGGGGGGSTNVNLDDLINGLGYDKTETPTTGTTQAGKMDELIAAVTAAGKIKKADVSNVGDTQAAIDSVSDILVFSDFNTIVPYKVTPLQLANRMALYDGLVERTVPSFPSALFLLMGSYYKLSVSTSDVAINLPALSSDGMAKIVMFRFTCTAATGGTTASFSVTVSGGGAKKGRGSAIPLALTPGTYEVDCVDNGSEWIVGVTEIVS